MCSDTFSVFCMEIVEEHPRRIHQCLRHKIVCEVLSRFHRWPNTRCRRPTHSRSHNYRLSTLCLQLSFLRNQRQGIHSSMFAHVTEHLVHMISSKHPSLSNPPRKSRAEFFRILQSRPNHLCSLYRRRFGICGIYYESFRLPFSCIQSDKRSIPTIGHKSDKVRSDISLFFLFRLRSLQFFALDDPNTV